MLYEKDKKNNVNMYKIEKMGVIVFENALRLHEDSILLFTNNRFPSAYALSVLSLEEIGKYFLLEDFVWHSRGDRYTLDEEEAFIKLIYHHRIKQNMFAYQNISGFAKKTIKHLETGYVEQFKQEAIYVGLPRKGGKIDIKGRISIPNNRISKQKSEKHITLLNDFILCLSAGVLKGFYIVDIAALEDVLTQNLIARLNKIWPKMSISAKKMFDKIMQHPDEYEN